MADPDEKDLFGSDDEDARPPPAPASVGGLSSRAGMSLRAVRRALAPSTPMSQPGTPIERNRPDTPSGRVTPTERGRPVTPTERPHQPMTPTERRQIKKEDSTAHSQSQGSAGAMEEEADERDLFGSDDDDDDDGAVRRPPAPASVGGISSRAGSSLRSIRRVPAAQIPRSQPPTPTERRQIKKEDSAVQSQSMGSASGTPIAGTPVAGTPTGSAAAPVDDNDDDGGRGLFGSDQEDEKDIFGSDDDAHSRASGPKSVKSAGKQSAGATSVLTAEEEMLFGDFELREMDEKDIFGELSADEDEAPAEELTLRRRPLPCAGRQFTRMKLPNILSAEKVPFDKETFDPETRACSISQEHIVKGTRENVKITLAENTIRWRFKLNKDGEVEKDAHGRPKYESNARFIEWEDGTSHLMVGDEYFSVLQRDESKQYLFNENMPDVMVHHGVLEKSLLITPVGITSNTHRFLKAAQFNKILPERKSLLATIEQTNKRQKEGDASMALEDEQRRVKKRKMGDGEDKGMNAQFLESEDADGPSLADIKRQYRNPDAVRRSKEIEDIASRHVR